MLATMLPTMKKFSLDRLKKERHLSIRVIGFYGTRGSDIFWPIFLLIYVLDSLVPYQPRELISEINTRLTRRLWRVAVEALVEISYFIP